jgi:hypothetical protein
MKIRLNASVQYWEHVRSEPLRLAPPHLGRQNWEITRDVLLDLGFRPFCLPLYLARCANQNARLRGRRPNA